MRSARPQTGFLERPLPRSDGLHRYVVYAPQEWNRRRKWPVILFLHGAGERGADGSRPTEVGLGPAIRKHPDRFPCLVAFPQCPLASWWTFPDAETLAMDVLERTVAEFRGDCSRIYLLGISMGGYGVWDLACNHLGVFAALAPVCGGIVPPRSVQKSAARLRVRLGPTERQTGVAKAESPRCGPMNRLSPASRYTDSARSESAEPPSSDPYERAALKLAGTPAWVFHGALDPVIPVSESRQMVTALRSAGAEVRYTEYRDVGHSSWERACFEPELIPWLLSQRLVPRKSAQSGSAQGSARPY